jgi:hypothetical protein
MAEALIKAHLCSEFAPSQLKLANKLFYWARVALYLRRDKSINKKRCFEQHLHSSEPKLLLYYTQRGLCVREAILVFLPNLLLGRKARLLVPASASRRLMGRFLLAFLLLSDGEKVNPCLGSGEKRRAGRQCTIVGGWVRSPD